MASTIKVDNIQNQCGANIIKEDSNTITLGASGDTIALASGASQTGFGRTGTVDWQTGSIKTATFTAENGKGYFCDTNGGTFEVDLPAGSAGAIVSIQDYRNTFGVAGKDLTVDPNGSEKINGGVAGGFVTLNTNGEGVTLVYIDSTIGWRSIQDNVFSDSGAIPTFITATGGTVTTVDTNYKVHTFTGPGTFTVCSVGNAEGSNEISYMVVAGGGAGGTHINPFGQGGSGGGGAGGFREGKTPQCSYTSSPIACTSGTNNGLPVSVTGYPITVGAGGTQVNYPAPGNGGNGNNSVFSTITSAAGGGGGRGGNTSATGNNGGSGGGGGGAPSTNPGGSGNTPPVSPPQGTNGGAGRSGAYGGGGGGGATVVGWDALAGAGGGTCAPIKGTGATTSINGTPTAFAGGGGGGGWNSPGTPSAATNAGGAGGGGTGAFGPQPSPTNATAGTTNTGGGGGGSFGSSNADGGAGGSGIVIIRYRFQ